MMFSIMYKVFKIIIIFNSILVKKKLIIKGKITAISAIGNIKSSNKNCYVIELTGYIIIINFNLKI